MQPVASLLCVLLCAFQDPSGEALIERLKAEATRLAALNELVARGEGDAADRRDPLLKICLQENGKPPLYVVLSKFLPDRDHLGGDASALFAPRSPSERIKSRLIDVFTAEGKLITPFGGNNVLDDGLLLDLNADPLIERADRTSYGPEGVRTAEVLEISAVLEVPRRLFAVVFNFHLTEHRDDWGYDFSQPVKDGPWEIHLGPWKNKREIEHKVSYRWDKAAGTWAGPVGGSGDHFRVIDAKNVWKSLEKLKTDKVEFPLDKNKRHLFLEDDPVPPPEAAKGSNQPYVPGSLKALSSEALLRYMGDGEARRAWSRVNVPGDFWTSDPKAAALALVKANQSDPGIRLAIDDRNDARAPDTCTVSFTELSSRCYNAIDTHWFLRCDPKGSFLASALVWEEGVAMRGRVRNGSIYDLKFVTLPYRDALHATQVLWWLSRVRSDSEGEREEGMMLSTADGKGDLTLRPAKDKPLTLGGRLWTDSLLNRWKGAFNPEAHLNFASAVITNLLPGRLGPLWPLTNFGFPEMKITEEHPGQMRNACKELLRRCSEDPDFVSAPVERIAIVLAGEKGMAECLSDLKKLEKDLAVQQTVTAAIQKLDSAKDENALERMAVSGNPEEAWALEELRVRFPEAHAKILERRLGSAGGLAALNLFHQLESAHPDRAAAVVLALDPDRRDSVAVEGFALLQKSGKPIPDEKTRVETLVSIALDPDAGWELRANSIDGLVPADAPTQFTSESIEAALLKLLDPALGDKSLNFTQSHAMAALVLRTGARYADDLLRAFHGAKDSFIQQGMLPTLARIAREPGPAREKVVAALRAEFGETQLMLNELAWSVWMGGLTELKPELERVATLGPDSPEGRQAHSAGGGRKAVTDRCHAARKVAAVWNETDAPTKAKLLAALAIMDLGAISDARDLKVARWDSEVAAIIPTLNGDGRREVLRFVAAQRSQSRGVAAQSMLDRLVSALQKD